MTTTIPPKQHKIWIDWMKGLGMLVIIWGHCFPDGMSSFIYAFNVPVFFLVSGYLTHREVSMNACFGKMLHNLIIPYFILAFIKAAGYIIGHLTDGQGLWSLLAIVGGFHQLHDAYGCSNLWFVYTLILIKFVYQLFPCHRLLTSLVAICGAVAFNWSGINVAWAVTNMLIALPFFMLGNYLSSQSWFERLTQNVMSLSFLWKLLLLFVCIAVTYVVSYYNGTAKMYEGLYGNYFVLFVVGALFGSALIGLLSLWLNVCDWRWVRITSVGSIITLVFHRELLHPFIKWVNKADMNIVMENLTLFLSSVIVLLAFVPIILVVKRFFPVLLGRRVNNI